MMSEMCFSFSTVHYVQSPASSTHWGSATLALWSWQEYAD